MFAVWGGVWSYFRFVCCMGKRLELSEVCLLYGEVFGVILGLFAVWGSVLLGKSILT